MDNDLNDDQVMSFLYINPIARLMDCIVGIFIAKLFIGIASSDKYKVWIDNHANLLGFSFWLLLVVVFLQSLFPVGLQNLQAAIYWPVDFLMILSLALLGTTSQDTITKKILNNKIIVYLGSCSLSFYLLHIPVINLAHHMNKDWYADSRNVAGAFVCLFITIIAAIISNYFIEKKLTNWLKRN